jgi:hypothetical protein
VPIKERAHFALQAGDLAVERGEDADQRPDARRVGGGQRLRLGQLLAG